LYEFSLCFNNHSESPTFRAPAFAFPSRHSILENDEIISHHEIENFCLPKFSIYMSPSNFLLRFQDDFIFKTFQPGPFFVGGLLGPDRCSLNEDWPNCNIS
jgi:hypothetical protein